MAPASNWRWTTPRMEACLRQGSSMQLKAFTINSPGNWGEQIPQFWRGYVQHALYAFGLYFPSIINSRNSFIRNLVGLSSCGSWVGWTIIQSNWSQCQNNSHHCLLLSSILDSSQYQLTLYWSRSISDGVTLKDILRLCCYTYPCSGKIKQRKTERHFSGSSRHQMYSSLSPLCPNILNFSWVSGSNYLF